MNKNLKIPRPTMPRFAGDLFRDLRDRRLLPLIAVLAVAIVAVPFALSQSSPEPSGDAAPGGAATASVAPGADSTLAVVAEESSLRDYRKRLGKGAPADPFEQHFTGPQGLDAAELGGGATGPSTTIGGGGSGELGGASTEPTTPLPGEPDEGSAEQPGETAPEEPAEPEPAWVVTVRVSMGEETNVRRLSETTVLPGTDNPLLVFRGLNEKGNKAVFRTGASVSAIFGDANCIKGSERCEELEIEPGFPVVFIFGETERLYRLTVVDIEHNR